MKKFSPQFFMSEFGVSFLLAFKTHMDEITRDVTNRDAEVISVHRLSQLNGISLARYIINSTKVQVKDAKVAIDNINFITNIPKIFLIIIYTEYVGYML